MTHGFFVTGTDTGVGKTFVAAALTRALVEQGIRTAVMKPVAAGGIETAAGFANDDALELLGASNVKAAYRDVNPYLLRAPASPHLAARAEGVAIRIDAIQAAYRRIASGADLVLVEGAGGWFAPISATETMADIATALELPVLLVVGLRLGCLNHALLTREAVRARGLRFAGWVANAIDPQMRLRQENIDTLAARFGCDPLLSIPHGAALTQDESARAATTLRNFS